MHSPEYNKATDALLLRLARGSIEHGFEHGAPLPVRASDYADEFRRFAATFTTVRHAGKLRGCCGTLDAARPLAADVAHTAFRAAFRDSRFEPLGRHEFDHARIEVSVLSPLETMNVADESDLLRQLVPGTDGLVIKEGSRCATFLPKVWETLPEPSQFVAQLKAKCGLPRDHWSALLEFQRYRTATYAETADIDR